MPPSTSNFTETVFVSLCYKTLDYSIIIDNCQNHGMTLDVSIANELDQKIGLGRNKKFINSQNEWRYGRILFFVPLIIVVIFVVVKRVTR